MLKIFDSMKKLIRVLLILLILFGFAVCGHFCHKIFFPFNNSKNDETIEIKIKHGMSLRAIADLLEIKGIIRTKKDFIFINKLFGNVNRLKAGKYDIPKGLSLYKVMKIIAAGKTTKINIVIPEGLISTQIASILASKVEIDSIKFMRLIHDKSVLSNYGINSNSLEGYLFPNTYYLYWGISEKEIINIFVKEFYRNFTDSLRQIATAKGWSVPQILTLASIIEGEAMIDSERSIISSVYHNRLEKRMLLQADPTIQFIISDGPRRLLKKDLALDSPYNTYRYPGLPPGPVNNPGIKSILAINPANDDYLYFVAKGDGTHIFSKSLTQHLNAKHDFDVYRKKISRKQSLNGRKIK